MNTVIDTIDDVYEVLMTGKTINTIIDEAYQLRTPQDESTDTNNKLYILSPSTTDNDLPFPIPHTLSQLKRIFYGDSVIFRWNSVELGTCSIMFNWEPEFQKLLSKLGVSYLRGNSVTNSFFPIISPEMIPQTNELWWLPQKTYQGIPASLLEISFSTTTFKVVRPGTINLEEYKELIEIEYGVNLNHVEPLLVTSNQIKSLLGTGKYNSILSSKEKLNHLIKSFENEVDNLQYITIGSITNPLTITRNLILKIWHALQKSSQIILIYPLERHSKLLLPILYWMHGLVGINRQGFLVVSIRPNNDYSTDTLTLTK